MKKPLRLYVITICLSFSLLLALALWAVAFAAPMPPRVVINPQIRQCAVIVPGDECGDVVLPPGWEYLDSSEGLQCPADYTPVELRPDWVHFKVSFCCTEGHSGSSGDCQDVVIHPVKRQCAFVEDIQKCAGLPDGWQASSQNCPVEFEWVSEVVCTSEEGIQTVLPTLSPPTQPASTPQPTAIPLLTQTMVATPEGRHSSPFPCASLGFTLVLFLVLKCRQR